MGCSLLVSSQATQGGELQPLLTHGLGNMSSVAWGSSHLHQQLSATNRQGDDFNSEPSPADGNDFSSHPDHKVAISVSTMPSPTEPSSFLDS